MNPFYSEKIDESFLSASGLSAKLMEAKAAFSASDQTPKWLGIKW